jgi:predicted glycoside hydrolase/deacetylase ChbG (UPF0249 family)
VTADGPDRPGRFLIVNADDFGQTPGINHGVIRAHRSGIVTSASLMVRGSGAKEAAAYARGQPELSVGLHFDCGEWAYRDEGWTPVYEVVATEDRSAVFEEAGRQLTAFRDLMGCDPTHIDSHQHVHRYEPVRGVLGSMARSLGVPLRLFSPIVRYCGDFYGQSGRGFPLPHAITIEILVDIVTRLPQGLTELGCHPGEGADVDSMYGGEREREVAVLCDPRLREAVLREGILLCSFHQVDDSLASPSGRVPSSGGFRLP